jgi:hypothetical protein
VLSVVCVQSFACCVYRYGHFMIWILLLLK